MPTISTDWRFSATSCLDPARNEVIIGVPSEAEEAFRARLIEIARAAGYGDICLRDM